MGRDPRFVEGIRMFNDREWFECHELLEDVWRDDPTPGRTFYQGLIQGSVALEHWRRGNPRGAASQWGLARGNLDPHRPGRDGVDLERYITQMEAFLAPIIARAPKAWRGVAADSVPPMDEAAAPRIALDE